MLLAETQLDASQSGTAAAVLFYLFALMAGGSALAVVASRNVVRMAVALLFTLTGVAGLYFLLNAEFLAAVQLVVYAGGTLILIVFGVMLTTKSPFSRFGPKLAEVVVAVTVAVVLLTALVMAVPVSATGEAVGRTQLSNVFDNLPQPLRQRVRYDGDRLWARGRVTAEDRRAFLATLDAEYQDRARGLDRRLAEAVEPAEQAPIMGERAALDADYNRLRPAVDRLADRSQRFFLADRPLPTGEGYPVTLLGQKLLGDYLLPFELASVLLLVVMIGAAYLAKGRRREETAAGAAKAYPSGAADELSRQARQWT